MTKKLLFVQLIMRQILQGTVCLLVCIAFISDALCESNTSLEFATGLDCSKGKRQCEGILRHAIFAGSEVGITISKNESGSVEVVSRENSSYPIVINFKDISQGSIRLIWDGDYNARQLSSSGLNCLDLGDISKILMSYSVNHHLANAINREGGVSTTLRASLMLYDGNDPTGQRYSVASLTPQTAEGVLEFEREWFDRHGIRGPANFSCLGALSVVLRVESVEAIGLKLGIPSGGAGPLSPHVVRNTAELIVKPTPEIVGNNQASRLSETVRVGPDDGQPRQNAPEYLPNPDDSKHEGISDDTPLWDETWSSQDEKIPVYGQAVAVY